MVDFGRYIISPVISSPHALNSRLWELFPGSSPSVKVYYLLIVNVKWTDVYAKWILLFFSIILNNHFLNGQNTKDIKINCAFDLLHAQYLASDSAYLKFQQNLEGAILQRQYDRTLELRSINYILPVVVHIISPPGTLIGEGNNLTDAEVLYGLDLLNQAFANKGIFESIDGVDVGIQFCLAKQTPEGLPTKGITRHESSLVADGKCNPAGTNMNNGNALKRIVNWDCKNYINIWLVTNLYNAGFGCSLGGFATFPGTHCTRDGIVQESSQWANPDRMKVTVHEMGHYLGLFHTFQGGCENSDCAQDGDKVCDTPPDDSPSYAPCNTNSCSTDMPDIQDDNSNYMDYSSCHPPHFTPGQRERMIMSLELGRPELIVSPGCNAVTERDLTLNIGNNPECNSQLCLQIHIKNTGLTEINSCVIEYEITGVSSGNYLWTGRLSKNESDMISLECLGVDAGLYRVNAKVISINGDTDQFPANSSIRDKPIEVQKMTVDFDIFSLSGRSKNFVNRSIGARGFLWDLGDGNQSSLPNPNHTYDQDGNYQVSLTAFDACDTLIITKEIRVVKCIAGLRGYVSGLNSYQEDDENICDIVRNGELGISKSLADISYYWTIFTICQDICTGNEFTFQIRLKNSSRTGGISAFDTGINLKTAGESVGVRVMGSPWGQPWSSIWAGNSRLNNRPELVLPLDDWVLIELKIKRDTIYYRYNGENFFFFPYQAEICNIEQMRISFKGSGRIDWIRILDDQDLPVYDEDFDDCTNLASAQDCNIPRLTAELQIDTTCASADVSVAANGGRKPYVYYLANRDTVYTQSHGLFDSLISGNHTVGVRTECPYQDTSWNVFIPPKLEIELTNYTPHKCQKRGSIIATGNGGIPPYRYTLNNGVPSASGIFYNLNPGTYDINVEDARGCKVRMAVVIEDHSTVLSLIVDSSKLELDCGDTSSYISVRIEGPDESVVYTLDDGPISQSGLFQNLKAGEHFLTAIDEFGCRSEPYNFEILDFRNHQITTDSVSICRGDTVYVGNSAYSSPGQYLDSLITVDGCDSIVWTHLRVLPIVSDSIYRSVCAGESVWIGDKEYSKSGVYRDTLISSVGCDSIISLRLAVNLAYDLTEAVSLCQGEFYQVGSSIYRYAGDYVDTLSTALGCDSIIRTRLDVLPTSSFEQQITLCTGETIEINNNSYFQSGTYRDTMTNQYGCDSIITTDLTILPVYIKSHVDSICAGESIWIGDKVYSKSGIFRDTLISSVGCDSIISLRLAVNLAYDLTEVVSICQGEFYQVGSSIYGYAGDYLDTLNTDLGCDSIIRTRLDVLPTSSFEQQIILCAGESLEVDGHLYTQSGTYADTLSSFTGCDSFLTTNLIIRELDESIQEYWICEGEVIKQGNNSYGDIGTYEDWFQNMEGCDSVVITRIHRSQNHYCDSLHCQFFIPDAFSPNFDGKNDYLTAFSDEIDFTELTVFDRYGGIIYSARGAGPRWDGMSRGKQVPTGVYVYLFKGICSTGKELIIPGSITLIR